MSYTTWLVILAVIALCVGPVMMFQPSARDRRLAELRTAAIGRGARVSLGSGQAKGFTRYAMAWKTKRNDRQFWRLMRKDYSHPIHLAEVWSLASATAPSEEERLWLEQQLPGLSDGIGLLEFAPDGAALFWSESGGKAELEPILQWLEVATQR